MVLLSKEVKELIDLKNKIKAMFEATSPKEFLEAQKELKRSI